MLPLQLALPLAVLLPLLAGGLRVSAEESLPPWVPPDSRDCGKDITCFYAVSVNRTSWDSLRSSIRIIIIDQQDP